ncbi:OmpA family protein [Cytophagales bacterium LB-30]|uniref:OmpA family protein n=2 Tax=Shiella aurantiaca TaxID=3058365 RepID=A0ABT8F8Z9_9BACT|nr:OmpA family protein [Shiella aurantiaca]
MRITVMTFLAFLSLVSVSLAQSDQNVYKADKYFSIRNYSEAIKLYKAAIESGNTDPLVHYRAGYSLFSMNDLNDQIQAIPYFEFAAKNKNNNVPNEVYLYLGEMLHKDIRLQEAITNYEAYKKLLSPYDKKGQEEVKRQLEICNNAIFLMGEKKDIQISRFSSPINSEFTEYNPVIAADQSIMAYTALKPNTDRSRPELKFLEEIYISLRDNNGNWGPPSKIDIETKYNVGTAGISPDGEQMLVFIGGVNNTGSIYVIKREENSWSIPVTIGNHVNSQYMESTASLTPDGKTVYFASNRPGGYGGFDIYRVSKEDNGQWGRAENMGPTINTAFDEDAPFIHPDQKTLFFTSTGHNTMGGSDIFKSVLMGGKWTKPENMGYPINTPANDSYFTLTADGSKGFFSSDRQGGLGGQDIYYFNMPDQYANIPLTMVKGRILAGDDLQPLPTRILVVDNESSQKIDFVYNPNPKTGNYLIILPPGKNYDMIIESEGYLPYTLNINVPDQTYFYELYQQIQLKLIKQFDVVVGQEVVVKNAFYDTKQSQYVDPKLANEAMLVQNDSLDIYDLMDGIIAASDEEAYDYLLDLMFKVNPIDAITFDESNEDLEAAKRVYYFDESDTTKLLQRTIEGETIFSLPTFMVQEEAQKQKEQKKEPITYDKALLNKVSKVYFDSDKSDLKTQYHADLNSIMDALNKHPELGIEIAGYASSDGNADYNRRLSNERAIAVLNYFNYKGVVRRRIVAKGYGATANETDPTEGRRVEIKLVDLNTVE